MNVTSNIAASVSNTTRRRPGPLSALTSCLRLLVELYQEARALELAAQARWPHIDE